MAATTRTQLLRAAITVSTTAALLTGCSSAPGTHPAPGTTPSGHRVTFEVDGHGTADISYSTGATGAYPQGTRHITLPWHTTVEPPTGGDALHLAVLLDHTGGHATCTILLDAHPVTSAPANGAYGRAVCQTQLPAAGAHQPNA